MRNAVGSRLSSSARRRGTSSRSTSIARWESSICCSIRGTRVLIDSGSARSAAIACQAAIRSSGICSRPAASSTWRRAWSRAAACSASRVSISSIRSSRARPRPPIAGRARSVPGPPSISSTRKRPTIWANILASAICIRLSRAPARAAARSSSSPASTPPISSPIAAHSCRGIIIGIQAASRSVTAEIRRAVSRESRVARSRWSTVSASRDAVSARAVRSVIQSPSSSKTRWTPSSIGPSSPPAPGRAGIPPIAVSRAVTSAGTRAHWTSR
ncbi:hypothetical protein SDC9_144831 [bioreactor metagenome]|uniref:Uncharacterized protein n=1 Tax=bioreactor metagenome TaxID=1076179 RepID=A0A645E729_9ZZZZ